MTAATTRRAPVTTRRTLAPAGAPVTTRTTRAPARAIAVVTVIWAILAAATVVGLAARAEAAPDDPTAQDTCVQPPPPAWPPPPLTDLVSTGAGVHGGSAPSVSETGRWVAFDSSKALTPDDTESSTDVFVRDRFHPCGPLTVLVSVDDDDVQTGDPSSKPSISADGRFVAFQSSGAFVPEDVNGGYDVYVHDRDADADGRYDEPGAISTVRVSVGPTGSGGTSPAISGDGTTVVFTTDEPLVATDQNGDYDAYVHDLTSGVTEVASVDTNGATPQDMSRAEAVSADGRHVVFRSDSDDLVAGDANGHRDVFVRDRLTATTERVSVGPFGEPDGWSGGGSISADGRYVAFTSIATNLVSPPTGDMHVFLRDRQSQTTELVDRNQSGAEPNGAGSEPSISADGRRVAFSSEATDLVPYDFFPTRDVFLRDLDDGTTVRVSVSTTGGNPNGTSEAPALAGDGTQVAYASVASNVISDDDEGEDVFARRVPTELEPRTAPAKSSRVEPGEDPTRVTLKFVEGSDVSLRDGRFTGAGRELNRTLERHGARAEKLVRLPAERIDALRRNAEALTGREHADFNLYFSLHLPERSDTPALLEELNAHEVVGFADAARTPVPASPTPSFTHEQGYRWATPTGLDSSFANQLAGGKGQDVGLVDIELGWNLDHEDLNLPPSTLLQTGGDAPSGDDDHGTAVLGTIAAEANGFGVTGMAPETTLHVATPPVANAVLWAADQLIFDQLAADVILVELAYPAAPGGDADLPVEVEQADFDAISLAVANGITVVEPAGNAGLDLDAYTDGGVHVLQRSVRDSGAIFVGAGCPPSQNLPSDYSPCANLEAIHEPGWWGSNHGSRLDVQGWGAGVRTLGYGTPDPCPSGDQCGFDAGPDRRYTGRFAGTSSAGATVAGAVSAAQGVHVAANGVPLPPASLRSLLVSTGWAQPAGDAAVRPIGPRPDLGAALDQFLPWWWGWFDIPEESCTWCWVWPGEELTWTVKTFGDARSARITIALPDGITFRDARGWSCAPSRGTVVCEADGISGPTTLQVTGVVDRDVRPGTVLRTGFTSTGWGPEGTRSWDLTAQTTVGG